MENADQAVASAATSRGKSMKLKIRLHGSSGVKRLQEELPGRVTEHKKLKRSKKEKKRSKFNEDAWLAAISEGRLEAVDEELKGIKRPENRTKRQQALHQAKGEPSCSSSVSSTPIAVPAPTSMDWTQVKPEPTVEFLKKKLDRDKQRREQESKKKEEFRSKVMKRILRKGRGTWAAHHLRERKKHLLEGSKERANTHIRYSNRRNRILLCLPPGVALPFQSVAPGSKETKPPPMKLCQVCGQNPKKYNSAKTGTPICSLQCFKIDRDAAEKHPDLPQNQPSPSEDSTSEVQHCEESTDSPSREEPLEESAQYVQLQWGQDESHTSGTSLMADMVTEDKLDEGLDGEVVEESVVRDEEVEEEILEEDEAVHEFISLVDQPTEEVTVNDGLQHDPSTMEYIQDNEARAEEWMIEEEQPMEELVHTTSDNVEESTPKTEDNGQGDTPLEEVVLEMPLEGVLYEDQPGELEVEQLYVEDQTKELEVEDQRKEFEVREQSEILLQVEEQTEELVVEDAETEKLEAQGQPVELEVDELGVEGISGELQELEVDDDQPEGLEVEYQTEEVKMEAQPEELEVDQLEELEVEDQTEEGVPEELEVEDQTEELEVEDESEQLEVEDQIEEVVIEELPGKLEVEYQSDEFEFKGEDQSEGIVVEELSGELELEDQLERSEVEDEPEVLEMEDQSEELKGISQDQLVEESAVEEEMEGEEVLMEEVSQQGELMESIQVSREILAEEEITEASPEQYETAVKEVSQSDQPIGNLLQEQHAKTLMEEDLAAGVGRDLFGQQKTQQQLAN